MKIEYMKDRILESSSIARRMYGVKLTLTGKSSDASKWFLFNRDKLIFDIKLKQEGLVLDIGSYLGEYTKRVLGKNPKMTFWLYEPIPSYFNACVNKFINRENVVVYQTAVSADGRDFQMQIDGLRSRQGSNTSSEGVPVDSVSIQEIFDSVSEIELLKMNIEGMEYECLEQLVRTNTLIKAKFLLIQFHNCEKDSQERRNALRMAIARDFNNIYTFEWIWELWIRKEE